jgi:hypothetical protein
LSHLTIIDKVAGTEAEAQLVEENREKRGRSQNSNASLANRNPKSHCLKQYSPLFIAQIVYIVGYQSAKSTNTLFVKSSLPYYV